MKRVEVLLIVEPDSWSIGMPERKMPGEPVSTKRLATILRGVADQLEARDEHLPVGYEVEPDAVSGG